MYRVCIGYVSGMYRECIETNKKNGGSICIFESFVLSLQKITVVFAQKMDWQTAIYRVGSYLRHCLTARHTGGHGIHSPYLFEWVRLVMRDEHSYYAWEKIEKVRERMLADTREVEFVDYGAGIGNRKSENGNRESGIGSPKTKNGNRESGIRKRESGVGSRESENGNRELGVGSPKTKIRNREARDRRKVSDIAKRSLAKKKYAQMLARLVNWLGDGRLAIGDGQLAIGDERLVVLELGTSLGVTTAYMAAMDKRNKVITYEGCPAVAEIAKENWKALGIKNIDCRVGEINADILDRDLERVDVAFIDANHTYAGTRAYFNVLAEKVHAKSVIVVDDIHYNKEMEKAWHEICEDERVTSTMDLYQMGLVFFDKDYWKRDYRIRV